MSTEQIVRQVAQAVLYEGYLLWPYRRSALKNQHRWTLGGVYPEPYHRSGGEPYLMRTECLLVADPGATLRVWLRFLHVVARDVVDGKTGPVPELIIAGERYLPGEEATEREVTATAPLTRLTAGPAGQQQVAIDLPAGSATQELGGDPAAGAVIRRWQALQGHLIVAAEPLGERLWRVAVEVVNTSDCPGTGRTDALARTFVSAHTVLHCQTGRFISAVDPPAAYRDQSGRCRNVGAWPVLVGAEGDAQTMLAAPIILPDYPRVAPESPGDLFDATEIDQLLTLSVLALTEEEQREIRATDPRARELLDRCASLTREQVLGLHGRWRQLRPGVAQ